MNGFKSIENKLQDFIKKYYFNELIKGSILFFSFGFLYLLFTLFIEYYLWLNTSFRTALFWCFITVEIFLFICFIGFPIFKLFGLKKRISLEESSKIIGAHFPEIDDKLINTLQLQNISYPSELLLASINQKVEELKPIPFHKAINFKKNLKFLRFALIPLTIWLLIYFSGANGFFKQSIQRVINYETTYIPPAPFSFHLTNTNLKVIEGNSLEVIFSVTGNIIPKTILIFYDNEKYFLKNIGQGLYSYTFSNIQEPFFFYVESNSIRSKNYFVDVMNTPKINSIQMYLKYPSHIRKNNDTIKNISDITVPEGTIINWSVSANETNLLSFLHDNKRDNFLRKSENTFIFSKEIKSTINYHITSSNNFLKDFEDLEFNINITKDKYPSINVISKIDSVYKKDLSFFGNISDDFGIKNLKLIYYDVNNPDNKHFLELPFNNPLFDNFYTTFPNKKIILKKDASYKIFFQVTDNDIVNNNKTTISKIFSYNTKSNLELESALLTENKSVINSLDSLLLNQSNKDNSLTKINQKLNNLNTINWTEKKNLENLLEKQDSLDKNLQQKYKRLQENFLKSLKFNPDLEDKKDVLIERIKELKKFNDDHKILDDLKKVLSKLDKETLLEKVNKIVANNKQKQRSLNRTLELLKRFYLEEKITQVIKKLDKLSTKQIKLSLNKSNNLDDQKKISKSFNDLKNELNDLNKLNNNATKPLDLNDFDKDKDDVSQNQKAAENKLIQNNIQEASKNQKNASNKLNKMSSRLQKAMLSMQINTNKENIDNLREILEDLLVFSIEQENLFNTFSSLTTSHPLFAESLINQNTLSLYFKNIDNSLFLLTTRLPQISSNILNNLTFIQSNIHQSLDNFSNNNFSNGLINQRSILNSTNKLANYLSFLLANMKNSMSSGMGSGKKSSSGFSLPDIIKKQGAISKQIENALKKSVNEVNNKESNQNKQNKNGSTSSLKQILSDRELFNVYKQQSLLRDELQKHLDTKNYKDFDIKQRFKDVIQSMNEIENDLLKDPFNKETISKMNLLNYDLLNLKKADLQQEKSKIRKSSINTIIFQNSKKRKLELKKQYYNQFEILNRQSLPLQKNYQEKVKLYFTK